MAVYQKYNMKLVCEVVFTSLAKKSTQVCQWLRCVLIEYTKEDDQTIPHVAPCLITRYLTLGFGEPSCWNLKWTHGLHWPTHLWDSIFVENLPEVPIFTSGGFPEFKRCHEGVLVWQSLRKHVPVEKEGHFSFHTVL